jgi:hypothetical protein
VWKLGEKSDSFEHLRLGGRTKIKCKVNTVNFNLEPAMKAQRGGEVMLYSFFNLCGT